MKFCDVNNKAIFYLKISCYNKIYSKIKIQKYRQLYCVVKFDSVQCFVISIYSFQLYRLRTYLFKNKNKNK